MRIATLLRSPRARIGLVGLTVLLLVLTGAVIRHAASAGSGSVSAFVPAGGGNGPAPDGSDGPNGQDAGNGSAAGDSGGDSDGGSGGGSGGGRKNRLLAWIPLGPLSPNSPQPQQRAYFELQTSCTADQAQATSEMSAPEKAFWRSAALACQALRDPGSGSSAQAWAGAQLAWHEASGFHGSSCYVDTVRSFMRELETAGFQLSLLTMRGESGGFACPYRHLAVSPAQGPPGTQVTLSWRGTPWLTTLGTVRFGDSPAGQDTVEKYSATVIVPDQDPGSPAAVDVVVGIGDQAALSFGSFTYTSAGTGDGGTGDGATTGLGEPTVPAQSMVLQEPGPATS